MVWEVAPPLGTITGMLPNATGRFYNSQLLTGTTTFTVTTNILYGVPIYVPTPTTYTSINIEVTTLSVGNLIRLGIYNDGGGVPTTLVLDAGTISTTTTGGKTIAISQALGAGWFWLAAVANSSVPVVRAASQTNALGWLGFTSGTDTTNHVGYSIAFTFGVLSGANPFGTGALMTTAAPRIMLGV